MSSFLDYTSPVAAGIANIFSFRGMIVKSALQRRSGIPPTTLLSSLKGGLRTAPTVGTIVGSQLVMQHFIEKLIVQDNEPSLTSTFLGSAVVGVLSTPVIAAYNGQTMGLKIFQSLKRLSPQQALAIGIQETAFVGGLSAASVLAKRVNKTEGNNIVVEYGITYFAGAAGSLIGHPANTVLTRLQAGLPIESRQLMLGAATKARATALFAIAYKIANEGLNSLLGSKTSCKSSEGSG